MQTTSVQRPSKTYRWGAACGPVRTIAFFPDGKRVATGGHPDGSVRVWTLGTEKEDGKPFIGHTLPALSVAVSKRGTDVVAGGADNKVLLWDVNNRLTPRVLSGSSTPTTVQICSVAFNFTISSMLVASGSSNGVINIWEVKADMDSARSKQLVIGNSTPISAIQFSPGYPNLIAVASFDKIVRVYDAYSGQQKAQFDGHTTLISSLVWFPGGQRIASGGDKTIRIWDPRTGSPIDEPLLGHTQLVKAVAISPQGRFIVSGSNDKTLRVWNAVTREQLGSPIVHESPVNLVAFSPDGRWLLSVTEKSEVYQWDTKYLEVEEALQRSEGTLDGLVSFSHNMQVKLHGAMEFEFESVRQEQASGIAELRQLFVDKVASDEKRFDDLEDAVNDARQSHDAQFVALQERFRDATLNQDTRLGALQDGLHNAMVEQENQFIALKEALREASVKQDTSIQGLQKGIKKLMEKHDSEFQELQKAQKGFATQQEANHTDIQQELRTLRKGMVDLGNYMKKVLPMQPSSQS